MFERFAQEARDAVASAQVVARSRGDDRITSAHLLLALVEDPASLATQALRTVGVDPGTLQAAAAGGADPLDADALAAIGVDLGAVRAQVEQTFGRGALDRPSPASRRHIPFAPDAKKALEQSLRVAMGSKARRIDTGHMLVAVALADDGAGQAVLARSGVTADAARAAVEAARAV